MTTTNDTLLKAITEASRASVKYDTPEQLADAIEVIFKRLLKLQEEAMPTSFVG